MASVRLSYVSREATAGRGRVCDKAPSGPHRVITQFEAPRAEEQLPARRFMTASLGIVKLRFPCRLRCGLAGLPSPPSVPGNLSAALGAQNKKQQLSADLYIGMSEKALDPRIVPAVRVHRRRSPASADTSAKLLQTVFATMTRNGRSCCQVLRKERSCSLQRLWFHS